MSRHDLPPLSKGEKRERFIAGAIGILFAVIIFLLFIWFVSSRNGSSATTTTTTTAAPPKPFRIVFPEGFTRADMIERVGAVARIAENELIAENERHKIRLSGAAYGTQSGKPLVVHCFGQKPQTNLEGFLFPATYEFLRGTTAKQLVGNQLKAFCTNWRRVNLAYASSKNLTSYDVLKIASMIESEVAQPSERKLVAAVIYNRLHAQMQLGIDATLRYGLHIPATQSITSAQLESDNPYNTRKLYGLPPTPISNPGLASIQAAAHPAHVSYLYYARVPGTTRHEFFSDAAKYNHYLATHGYGPHS